jgi:hypothetical protein
MANCNWCCFYFILLQFLSRFFSFPPYPLRRILHHNSLSLQLLRLRRRFPVFGLAGFLRFLMSSSAILAGFLQWVLEIRVHAVNSEMSAGLGLLLVCSMHWHQAGCFMSRTKSNWEANANATLSHHP